MLNVVVSFCLTELRRRNLSGRRRGREGDKSPHSALLPLNSLRYHHHRHHRRRRHRKSAKHIANTLHSTFLCQIGLSNLIQKKTHLETNILIRITHHLPIMERSMATTILIPSTLRANLQSQEEQAHSNVSPLSHSPTSPPSSTLRLFLLSRAQTSISTTT